MSQIHLLHLQHINLNINRRCWNTSRSKCGGYSVTDHCVECEAGAQRANQVRARLEAAVAARTTSASGP